MEGRKVGRPSKGDKAKRAPLNMKTTPQLRDRMQRAADANGVTVPAYQLAAHHVLLAATLACLAAAAAP